MPIVSPVNNLALLFARLYLRARLTLSRLCPVSPLSPLCSHNVSLFYGLGERLRPRLRPSAPDVSITSVSLTPFRSLSPLCDCCVSTLPHRAPSSSSLIRRATFMSRLSDVCLPTPGLALFPLGFAVGCEAGLCPVRRPKKLGAVPPINGRWRRSFPIRGVGRLPIARRCSLQVSYPCASGGIGTCDESDRLACARKQPRPPVPDATVPTISP